MRTVRIRERSAQTLPVPAARTSLRTGGGCYDSLLIRRLAWRTRFRR